LEPYLYLLPGLFVFTVFVVVPIVAAVGLSLTAWNGVSWDTATFVGLENYIQALEEPRFWTALWHNLVLIPYFVILPTILGLAPAALVGPINSVLEDLGFSPPTWLADFTLALPTIGLIGAWAAYGFCYVVFVAGIQKIPADLYDAARLDGASGWQEFTAVTLPGLRREIAVVLSVNLINALRAFDIVRATTDGGPGDSTDVLALFMVDSLDSNRAGYAIAIAMFLAIITLVLSLSVLKVFGASDD
jgi:raffinose/stachyose/melibiose transport system permease protein